MNASRKKIELGLVASASRRAIWGVLRFHERRVWTDQMRCLIQVAEIYIGGNLSVWSDWPPFWSDHIKFWTDVG